MLRLVVIAALMVLAWLALIRIIRAVRAAKLDWSGIAFIVGFIALAFYLRHVTGMG